MDESDESGSAYEIPLDEAPSSLEEDTRNESRASTSKPSKLAKAQPSKGSKGDISKLKTEIQVLEDAAEWASKFQAPLSAEDVKTPPRKAARVRPRVKRKSLKEAPNKVRAKRLKPYYNDDYRLLLNDNIQDAASGMLEEDHDPLKTSQIGSSSWTSAEKDVFFTALGRSGRNDVRGIAAKIGTKSEVEVHDYMLHLDQGVRRRHSKGAKLLQSIELPAALEISDECCAVLERAGAAITARQEIATEKVEREKWGDSWLLTKDVSKWIEKRIRQKGGEDEIQEVLPAANLLNLANWLELSREVFMNPGPGLEDDNWTNIAEQGETPAIRATAFEDFHSLTANITKRLLSTVLFCTMSRLRARDSHLAKHAEVRPDDVEAAVQILGLKSNSNEFWINCARRCNLAVIDDGHDDSDDDEDGEGSDEDEEEVGNEEEDADSDSDSEEDIYMTYSAIEATLRTTNRRSRSRSRSVSHPPRASKSTQITKTPMSSPEDYTSPESSSDIYSSADEEFPSSRSERSVSRRSSSREINEAEKIQALEDAQDTYAETMDIHASSKEEAQLWQMLRQTAPFEIDTELVEDLKRPKSLPTDAEGRGWRDYMDYVSSWETLETPVPEVAFKRNRMRLSRRGKRKASRAFSDDYGEEPRQDGDGDETQAMDDQAGELAESDAEAGFEEQVGSGDEENQYHDAGNGHGEEELEDTVMNQQQDEEYANSQTSVRARSQSTQSNENQFQIPPPREWDFHEVGFVVRERSIDSE